jgi:phosphotransacetylase
MIIRMSSARLQIHHTRAAAGQAAGVYIMIVKGKMYLFTDATVNIDPSAQDLARLPAWRPVSRELGIEPRGCLLLLQLAAPRRIIRKVQRQSN